MFENFRQIQNSSVIPNCSNRIFEYVSRYCADVFSLSVPENNAYVHKTTELGRLGRMHYARALTRVVLRAHKSVSFRSSNSRELLPSKSYFAAAFPFDSSLTALKTFETTEADSLSVLARVIVGKAGDPRDPVGPNKKSMDASECSRKSRKLLSVDLLCIFSLVESP